MDPEEVTLAVPCYNVAETLPRVLTSIDHLDPAPSRTICIDDGSTDGTKKIIRAHGGVELVEHSQNRGIGAALNTALLRTRTPGMAKIDADIVVESDWLGELCAACEEHDADLVQGRFEEEVITTADKWRERHLMPNFLDEPIYNKPINGANILCRTDALRAIGGWDERYVRTFDDIDLFQRLITAGHRLYYTPAVVTTHLRTDTRDEILHAAWAYHYGSFGQDTGRLPPESLREMVLRLPDMLARSVGTITADLQNGAHDLLGISLLRPLYHLKYDIESLRSGTSRGENCLEKEQIEYGDITIDLRDGDVITPWMKRLFCRGMYEREEAEIVTKYLDSDSDVLELGGGIGYLSCVIDDQLSNSRRQVVVEPNRTLLSLIERNRELNDGAFEVVNAAYSRESDSVTLQIPEQFWSASVGVQTGTTNEMSVDAVDLSTLLDRYDLSNVSVIVDIEGSELELIEHELDVLESRCELFVVEFHPHHVDSSDDVEQAKQTLERSFKRIDQEGSVYAYQPDPG